MMFRKPRPVEDLEAAIMRDTEEWLELLYLAQLNNLSLAHLLLATIDDPDSITDEMRQQVLDMIESLEYGAAHFQEFII